jgi:hypothetical protein
MVGASLGIFASSSVFASHVKTVYSNVSLCKKVSSTEPELTFIVGNSLDMDGLGQDTQSKSAKGITVEVYAKAYELHDGSRRMSAVATVHGPVSGGHFPPIAVNVPLGSEGSVRMGNCEEKNDVGGYIVNLSVIDKN